MRKRTLGGLVVAATIGLGIAPPPATAADDDRFRLSTGAVVAKGDYETMMSIPERPVPPFRITATLVGRGHSRCAVIQVGRSGPADGLEWQTFGRHCGPGRTKVRAHANYMFRGVEPPVRLCAGWTAPRAVDDRRCDVHRPAADR